MIDKEKSFEPETRNNIYQFILNYPGVHFSKISQQLEIPKSTLNYHLNYLIKKELITKVDEEKYMRFFITKKIGVEDKKLLKVFRKETQRKIILYILKNSSASQIELSKELKRAPSTISEHLQKLINLDIIEVAKKKDKNNLLTNYDKLKTLKKPIIGREKPYILQDPYYIYKFLKENENKILDDGEVSKLLSLIEISDY